MPKKAHKTLVICSNYAWTIYNFRMPLIRELKRNGYEVHVITQFDGYEKEISKEVDGIRSLFISRDGVNPFYDVLTFLDILRKLFNLGPSYILLFSIKPVIYGSLAARVLKISTISMITGLGTGFLLDNWVTRIVKRLYKIALAKNAVVFFQNIDDEKLFVAEKLASPQVCRLSPGSGIDVVKFSYNRPTTESATTFLLIARMLLDKGILEFVEAARYVKNLYPNTKFQLLGPLGVANRTAVTKIQMDDWVSSGVIDYLGETDNVSEYIKKASCIVLPSYREGTSRVLLEAAAMGAPIIATNVPGCREIVEDGENGLLCRPKDSSDLAEKMIQMLLIPYETRREMGVNGRVKMENEYDQNLVFQLYLDALDELTCTN